MTTPNYATRLLGQYDFEGGGCLRITLSGDVTTAEALDMIGTLVELRRTELKRRSEANTRQLNESETT